MFWVIESFPPQCEFHIFLSHSGEDRADFVFPLFNDLTHRGIVPWLDRHHYPYGRGSRAALRDSILQCRHTVFLITDAMLASPRGWCVQELVWAELLQANLVSPGAILLNVILPLFFTDFSDSRLSRSVWQLLRDSGKFCPAGATRVEWAANEIEAFLRREEQWASHVRTTARPRSDRRTDLKKKPGLLNRVTRFDPQPLPPVTGLPPAPR